MLKNHRRQQQLAQVERIWSLDEFAAINSMHPTTLYRAIKRGDGPPVVKLSLRRLGIRESDGAAWQAARVQERG
jgi:predicted DNA-binding transcriptional regulator AlpA